VWVLRDGVTTPEPVRIRTGVSDGSTTEVIEGELREGDAAVTDVEGGAAAGPPSGGSRSGGGMRRIF
jgi:HlyD family secretion protein